MKINEKLKNLRLEFGMTQEEVGRAIFNNGYEITKAAISQYELNKRNIALDMLEPYANVFGYTVDLVLTEKKVPQKHNNFYKTKTTEEILELPLKEKVDYIFVKSSNLVLSNLCGISEKVLEKLSLGATKELLLETISSLSNNDLKDILDGNTKKEFSEKYDYVTICFKEMLEIMKKATLESVGVNIDYSFELASDGNLDLFIDTTDFTEDMVVKLVNAGWFSEYIISEYNENQGDYNPFDYDDELCNSEKLFQFIFKKAFGEKSEVVGYDDSNKDVYLRIKYQAIDANSITNNINL